MFEGKFDTLDSFFNSYISSAWMYLEIGGNIAKITLFLDFLKGGYLIFLVCLYTELFLT